jgi:hypothetical protein
MVRSTELMIEIMKTPSCCHSEYPYTRKRSRLLIANGNDMVSKVLLGEIIRSARRFHQVALPNTVK